MLNNAAECGSGTIVCNGFVQNPEQQSRKKYSRVKTSLPDGSNNLVHTVEFF